jgi:hypothetical protein
MLLLSGTMRGPVPITGDAEPESGVCGDLVHLAFSSVTAPGPADLSYTVARNLRTASVVTSGRCDWG